jgi:hypothetical protein
MTVQDDFAAKGYLSSDISFYRESVREEFAAEFDETAALSDCAHRLILNIPVDEQLVIPLAATIFLERTVRSCQAAFLLSEKGLNQEAQVLVRTATENLFVGAALLVDDRVFNQLALSSDHEETVHARGMMKIFADSLTPERSAILQSVVDRAHPKATKYPIYNAARTAGLTDLYETFYRGLSGKASHATLRSLDTSFTKKDGRLTLISGPSEKELSFTLGTIRTCLKEAIRQSGILSNRVNESA